MESRYQYQFAKRAEADLDDIIRYIAVELMNPVAAGNFLDELQKVIDRIRMFPESGSLVLNDFIPDMGVRKKVIGNYIMYYLPDSDDQTIIILRIVYGRRNMDEILRTLGDICV